MRLNNHGFGMREMIIYTCVLILFLLLAVYLVNALYDNIEVSSKNNKENNKIVETPKEEKEQEEVTFIDYEYYKNKETSLRLATYNYLNDTNPEINGILKITDTQLIEKGYLEKIYNHSGERTCTAYSNVVKDNESDYTISSYINCGDYITEGY